MREDMSPVTSMIPNAVATRLGLIPVRCGAVCFAVGSPNGLTSNSWRLWTAKHGDIYIACRDNFKEVKVSLHASGRWRMGYTVEAVAKKRDLLSLDENRAWEVWDEPSASLPNTVVAFRLLFPTSELAVRPEQRVSKKWSNVIYVEEAPPGKLTVLTLFVTVGDAVLKHESEPSFALASLDIGNNRRAKLVAHGDREGNIPDLIERSVAQVRRQAEAAGIAIPSNAYAYLFGRRDDGCRFLVGARMTRSAVP